MKIIERKIFELLKKHLNSKEISLITGPRQSGKTTLMLELKSFLEKKGENVAFFNFDFESDKIFLESQNKLLEKIRLEFGGKSGYVFIDEMQRKEDAGLFLKGIYDMNLPYKFIVSGSGSVELKAHIHESLAGRKRLFELNTISFEEFINFKTDYKYQDQLENFFQIEKEKTLELAKEYITFGGYPRVILAQTTLEKTKIIEEIYTSFVEKDLAYLLGIQKTEDLGRLLKIISSQIGNLVNYSELSSTLGLSQQTVNNYLWYTEKTFVIDKITPFYRNVRSEITKSPTYYFTDLGMRNFILGTFGNYNLTIDDGFLFQNFIYLLIKNNLNLNFAKIHFWRTKDGAETDFILENGQDVIPIEVKSINVKNQDIPRSFRNFINKYNPPQAYLVNLSLDSVLTIDQTKINFIPYYQVLFIK